MPFRVKAGVIVVTAAACALLVPAAMA